MLLTRQFRFPAYVNDHPDGMLLETAAGLLDQDDPEDAIRREAVEETGVEVGELDVDEARAKIGTDIVDAKTVMLLQWAFLDGPFAPSGTT